MDVLKGIIHFPVGWPGIARFRHTVQNSRESKSYELFISGMFHLIFSGHSLTLSN